MPGEEYLKSLAETIREMEPTPTRDTYINTLRTTGVSVAEKIVAANGLYELNIKEGRTKNYQTQAQELYGKDPRTIKESKTNHYNPNWKVQSLYDSVRIARELGAENALELEAKVKSVGRAYGKIKREYAAAKKQYNETINTASAEFSAENSELSVAERLQRLEAIIETESQKLQPLEKRFNETKNYYKKCARALEATQEFNVSKDLYTTPGEQYQYNPEKKKQETPYRSKAEAEKEREKQWNELRDWADEAKETVAQKAGSDPENDLNEWVAEMKKHGCQVRITANTISLKHPDSNQAVRTNRLDNKYAKENIINDISVQRKDREKERANETTAELGGNRSNEKRNNGDEKINDNHSSEHVKEFRNTSEFER